jgi:hypothetical protein
MTRIQALALSLVTAATAALFTVLPANGQDPAGPRKLMFTSIQKPGDERYVDLPPKGPSAGDRIALSSQLHEAGKAAGRLEGDCVVQDKPFAVIHCGIVVLRADGRLTLHGAYAGKRIPHVGGMREEYAVTGGTGAYDGATGSMTRTGGGERDTLTLTLGG